MLGNVQFLHTAFPECSNIRADLVGRINLSQHRCRSVAGVLRFSEDELE
jgi:hypothetical protein